MTQNKMPEDGWPLDFIARVIGADPTLFKSHVRGGGSSSYELRYDRVITERSIGWILDRAHLYGCQKNEVERRWNAFVNSADHPMWSPLGQGDQSGGFYLCNKSTMARIESFLTTTTKPSAIWVTYSFGPFTKEQLEWLRDKFARIRVLCRHPRDGSVNITPDTYRSWIEAGLGDDIWGLVATAGDDDEAEPPGALHAKAIAILCPQSTGGYHYRGVVGSFNLTKRSLSYNTETVAEVSNGQQLHYEIEQLFASPFVLKITPEDCEENEYRFKAGKPDEEQGQIVAQPTISLSPSSGPSHYRNLYKNPPRDTYNPGQAVAYRTQPLPVYQEPQPFRYDTPALNALHLALAGMMKSWPAQNAQGQGWQEKIYRTLWKQLGEHGTHTDVLYLPVALGKTFIGLRWLLHHYRSMASSHEHTGLFLAPNEWVARSVQNDVDKIVQEASRITPSCSAEQLSLAARQCWRVIRPSEFASQAQAPVACVADECHNWNAEKSAGIETYSGAVNQVRAWKIPLLGLSATPCRMDSNAFDVGLFLNNFRTRSHPNVAPFLSTKDAHNEGLLADHKFIPLLRGKGREEIESLLWRGDAPIKMGDYHMVVLREVWNILQKNSKSLLGELQQQFTNSKRILVFMPPVKEASDSFVKKLQGFTSGDRFFDFRDRADEGRSPRKIFESFRDAQGQRGSPAILVTINRFSEGVSINDIDTLVMLRATLSPRIATQAIGRGLRLDPANPGKVCKILDPVCIGEMMEAWEEQA